MSDDRITVFMLPDYTSSNPYQTALINALDSAGVEVIAVTPNGWFPLLSAWNRHGRPDVIHLHWLHKFVVPTSGSSLISLLLAVRLVGELVFCRLRGVGLVWTVHNLMDHERTAPQIELVTRHLTGRLADRIIVHCETAGQLVGDRYRLPTRVRKRMTVIPHGNYDGQYDRAVGECDLPTDGIVLLYFGIIRPYKNVPKLIDTVRRLDENEVRLHIVGNPWNDALEEQIRQAAAADERISLKLGFVPDEDVSTYFANADVIVLPFARVLTSGSAILAMTYGRPVIAPRAGCLPELLGDDGGFLYDDTTDDGLGQAIQSAIANPGRLSCMGNKNRRKADSLTWREIGQETATAYRSTVTTSHRPRKV